MLDPAAVAILGKNCGQIRAPEHGKMGATKQQTLSMRLLAKGQGWSVHDFVCTAGPQDQAFEEQHTQSSVAIVLSGSFQYGTATGRELMVPGSLLLGNAGDGFVCGHEHGVGDRCISFHYSDEFREQAGADPDRRQFHLPRIPAIRALSPLVAGSATLLENDADPEAVEELALQIFRNATYAQHGFSARQRNADASSLARVSRVLRAIDAHPEHAHELAELAAHARLSPFHFLRCFEDLTGTTPRQYLLRTRLRRAAVRLKQESARVIDIALDCGFGDVSNFNRAFRAEFGTTPRIYRRT